MLNISEKLKKDLLNKKYGIYNHSAVQICEWTKKSLRGVGECYKNQFYGVETYSCAQISPNVMWCDQNCIFCWRPAENMLKRDIKAKVDAPKDIIDNLVRERYKLLTGFGGNENINVKKREIALNEFPSHWAISLSGEPTLYPKLPELVIELKKRKVKSIFIVSNGQNPKMIKKLEKISLPTQLYISLDAWDEKSFLKINRSIRKDGWKRLLKSLNMLGKLNTRTVIRLTIIKGINDSKKAIKEFAKIIDKANPDFLEIKSYMHLGYSRERLKRENMPSNEDLNNFCKELDKHLKNLKYEDKCLPSKIILYMNTGEHRKKPSPNRWIIPKNKWRIK